MRHHFHIACSIFLFPLGGFQRKAQNEGIPSMGTRKKKKKIIFPWNSSFWLIRPKLIEKVDSDDQFGARLPIHRSQEEPLLCSQRVLFCFDYYNRHNVYPPRTAGTLTNGAQ